MMILIPGHSMNWKSDGKWRSFPTSYRYTAGKVRAAELLAELQQNEAESLHLALEDKIVDPGANLTAGQRKILMYARALSIDKPILRAEPRHSRAGQRKTQILDFETIAYPSVQHRG